MNFSPTIKLHPFVDNLKQFAHYNHTDFCSNMHNVHMHGPYVAKYVTMT